MYAIIETGGKQYKVEKGDVIDVDLLNTEDSAIEFEKVLFFTDGEECKVGVPHVEKCVVIGQPVDEVKGPKVVAFKYKRRKNYSRKVGHRQKYSRVKITDIKMEK
jgi:large subunit ribosomal protein L21